MWTGPPGGASRPFEGPRSHRPFPKKSAAFRRRSHGRGNWIEKRPLSGCRPLNHNTIEPCDGHHLSLSGAENSMVRWRQRSSCIGPVSGPVSPQTQTSVGPALMSVKCHCGSGHRSASGHRIQLGRAPLPIIAGIGKTKSPAGTRKRFR